MRNVSSIRGAGTLTHNARAWPGGASITATARQRFNTPQVNLRSLATALHRSPKANDLPPVVAPTGSRRLPRGNWGAQNPSPASGIQRQRRFCNANNANGAAHVRRRLQTAGNQHPSALHRVIKRRCIHAIGLKGEPTCIGGTGSLQQSLAASQAKMFSRRSQNRLNIEPWHRNAHVVGIALGHIGHRRQHRRVTWQRCVDRKLRFAKSIVEHQWDESFGWRVRFRVRRAP